MFYNDDLESHLNYELVIILAYIQQWLLIQLPSMSFISLVFNQIYVIVRHFSSIVLPLLSRFLQDNARNMSIYSILFALFNIFIFSKIGTELI